MNPETYDSRDGSDDDEPTGSGPSIHPLGPILGNVRAVAAEPLDPARLTLLPTDSPSGAGVSRPRRARIGIRTAAIGALLLIVALIATTTWAMGVKADVDRTFADASAARLAASDVAGRIQQSKSDLSREQSAVALADDANAKLERQVENQAICAAAQRSDWRASGRFSPTREPISRTRRRAPNCSPLPRPTTGRSTRRSRT